MYQALVRLPRTIQTDSAALEPPARMDWSAVARLLMRLLSPAPVPTPRR